MLLIAEPGINSFEKLYQYMKQIILLVIIAVTAGFTGHGQEIRPESGRQFMQINTVESVLAGGMGRSKMIITNPDGSQKEADLDNLFSLAGINFKNIKDNEAKLVKTQKQYTDEGGKLEHVTSLTLSQNDNGARWNIYDNKLSQKCCKPAVIAVSVVVKI